MKKSQGEGRESPRDFFTLSIDRERVYRLLFGGRRSLERGCLFEKIAVYKRAGKSVIWLGKKAQKGQQMQTQWVPFWQGGASSYKLLSNPPFCVFPNNMASRSNLKYLNLAIDKWENYCTYSQTSLIRTLRGKM